MPKLYYFEITIMISNNVPVDDNDFIPLYLRFILTGLPLIVHHVLHSLSGLRP